MPYKPMPQFKSTPDKMFEIPQPGMGGLNLKDLEFEQDPNQSPYMKNVMYRNGAFAKRYGQEYLPLGDGPVGFTEIYDAVYYDETLFLNIKVGNTGYIYYHDGEGLVYVPNRGLPADKGWFMIFNQRLFYFNGHGTSQNDFLYEITKQNGNWHVDLAKLYVPDVLINCETSYDERYSDPSGDDFNLLLNQFDEVYNGDGVTTEYYLYDYEDSVAWNSVESGENMAVYVDDVELVYGTTKDYHTKTEDGKHFVVFHIRDNAHLDQDEEPREIGTAEENSAIPGLGNMNVVITLPLGSNIFYEVRKQILNTKVYSYFGGRNDSRVFLAGNGKGKMFWSNIDDITYFPENNWMVLGNSEEDITGLARQYNILVAFKPNETYSIYSYIQDSSTTIIEEEFGLESFKSQLINNRIGCDCPHSIQLINNLLTWFSTRFGLCTLVSTNIQDERNIRIISRNVDRSSDFNIKGILDYTEDPYTIKSVDWDNKYFLVFPDSGNAYVWDYEISPYRCTQNGETPPSKLAWFFFDNFHVGEFINAGKDLLYTRGNKIVQLGMGFNDFGESIESFYMTPFIQFGAVESLKNVKNIYVQCRGDTATKIDMWYYDEATLFGEGEMEPESITIGSRLWQHFAWTNFTWYIMGWANTFRRKCNLKKVQMASFFFKNDEENRDMSITHIGLQYQVVKYIR